jgi:uncharacterized protein (TIGR02453 family)
MPRTHFKPDFFRFLRQLKSHNQRAWFQVNKERYESLVRNPFLDFIGELGPPLRRISPRLVVDNSPTGGSMFRIYRDTRFSKDKTPYKTHVAAQFRLSRDKDVHSPGYYLHLEPGEVFGGGGLWRPEPPVLGRIRDRLANHPRAFRAVLSDRRFRKRCVIEGDKLQRPPKGYDPGHELIDHIKYKDFIFYSAFTEKQACSPGFLERYVDSCAAAAPFMEFLSQALMLEW